MIVTIFVVLLWWNNMKELNVYLASIVDKSVSVMWQGSGDSEDVARRQSLTAVRQSIIPPTSIN